MTDNLEDKSQNTYIDKEEKLIIKEIKPWNILARCFCIIAGFNEFYDPKTKTFYYEYSKQNESRNTLFWW